MTSNRKIVIKINQSLTPDADSEIPPQPQWTWRWDRIALVAFALTAILMLGILCIFYQPSEPSETDDPKASTSTAEPLASSEGAKQPLELNPKFSPARLAAITSNNNQNLKSKPHKPNPVAIKHPPKSRNAKKHNKR